MRPLIYLSDSTFGGWVTFTAHLAAILGAHLYKVTPRGERRVRPFGYGVGYQNIDHAVARAMDRPVVTACAPSHQDTLEMLRRPTIVIHDPTECTKRMVAWLPQAERVIVMRQTVASYLEDRGIKSTWLRHPYQRANLATVERQPLAIGLSRIDWDKNIDIILAANAHLRAPIRLWGTANRQYVWHKLKALDFERYYAGPFPKGLNTAQRLARQAKAVVDMSTIAHDGGGTQYTFLEAIDAGTPLILNTRWIQAGDTFKSGWNCYAVADSDSLAALLTDDLPGWQSVASHAAEMLANHRGEPWIEALG